jgi:carbonic anhydrase
LGLHEGDAHVIRNAGGRAVDALRSIIISQQLLGTREIVILHHVRFLPRPSIKSVGADQNPSLVFKQADCGMLTFPDSVIRSKISARLGENPDHIAFLPFEDLEQSVRDDIDFLRKSNLVLDVPVTGYIYDVKTGKIDKVST